MIITYKNVLKSSRHKTFEELTLNDFPLKYRNLHYLIYIEKGKGQKPLK